MEPLIPGTILLALVIYLTYHYILRPLLFSSLSKIPPAHPLAPITSKWFEYRIAHSRELKTLYAAHNTHGPIVRLGPREISVVSLEGLRKVYTAGLDKDPWYQTMGMLTAYGMENLVATLDHATHSRVKRSIAGDYQKSYLLRSGEMDALSRRVVFERFMPMLKRFGEQGKDVDVVPWFEWTGVDFISGYLFGIGSGTDFLSSEEVKYEYFGEHRNFVAEKGAARPVTEDIIWRMSQDAVSADNPGDKTKTTVAAKLHAYLSANAEDLGLSSEDKVMRRCAGEMLDHIIATQEVQTTTWTYILHRLSQNPKWQEDLRAELLSLRPTVPNPAEDVDHKGNGDSELALPSPSNIDALPILHAIVYETLRLHAGNPARLPRLVPAGGITLHGHYIPPGVTVSSNAYCLHRNADAFPKPLEWRPERWLSGRESELEGSEPREKWFWPFGSGPRVCIGQHFGMQVLKLVVAAIYTHYTTSIVDDVGIEQEDGFISGPVSHRLILRFHPV